MIFHLHDFDNVLGTFEHFVTANFKYNDNDDEHKHLFRAHLRNHVNLIISFLACDNIPKSFNYSLSTSSLKPVTLPSTLKTNWLLVISSI